MLSFVDKTESIPLQNKENNAPLDPSIITAATSIIVKHIFFSLEIFRNHTHSVENEKIKDSSFAFQYPIEFVFKYGIIIIIFIELIIVRKIAKKITLMHAQIYNFMHFSIKPNLDIILPKENIE